MENVHNILVRKPEVESLRQRYKDNFKMAPTYLENYWGHLAQDRFQSGSGEYGNKLPGSINSSRFTDYLSDH
jgi:hypothetical protein